MFFGEDLRESGLRSKARSESAAQSSRVKAQHYALMDVKGSWFYVSRSA